MSTLKSVQDKYTLSNGYKIPCLGLGTWQMEEGEQAAECVRQAIACGYRHIDTAAAYHNERGVGEGVRTCGVPREEIFVTDKVWNSKRGYDKTKATFDKTMQRLAYPLQQHRLRRPHILRQLPHPINYNGR